MSVIIIIIIIITNEEIIVAFSPKTTRTRYKVKKTKPRDTSCLAIYAIQYHTIVIWCKLKYNIDVDNRQITR